MAFGSGLKRPGMASSSNPRIIPVRRKPIGYTVSSSTLPAAPVYRYMTIALARRISSRWQSGSVDRAKLALDLIRDEGERMKMYKDSRGFATIGVGHNLDAKPISQKAVRVILDDDITDAEMALDKACPWWRLLDEVRQRVLCNMCFNMGIGTLLTFKRTLAAIEAHQFDLAAEFMMESLWSRQVGDGPGGKLDRAERLATMMRTGKD